MRVPEGRRSLPDPRGTRRTPSSLAMTGYPIGPVAALARRPMTSALADAEAIPAISTTAPHPGRQATASNVG